MNYTLEVIAEGLEIPWGMAFLPRGGDEINLLVGSLKYEYLDMCVMQGDKVAAEEMLLKNIGRVRNVRVGPEGYIYVAVEDPGTIYKLIPE